MVRSAIYITTDSTVPKTTEKWYGYVLECMVTGETRTKEGFGKITGTYHQAVLKALAEALARFRKESEIHIYSEDAFVLGAIKGRLGEWAQNDFLTAKQQPIANRDAWKKVWELSGKHLILTEPGRHSYTGWIREEIERRKEQQNV